MTGDREGALRPPGGTERGDAEPGVPARPPLAAALAIAGGSTLMGVLTAAGTISSRRGLGERFTVGQGLWASLPGWWLWGLAVPLVAMLGRRWRFRPVLPSLAIHGGFALVVTALHGVVMVWSTQRVYPDAAAIPWITMYKGFIGTRLPLDLVTYAAMLAILLALDGERRLGARVLIESELRADVTRAQLETLRMQLQPHFLFNTLHSIGVLMRRDPDGAERVLALLGDLLRATLHGRARQVVPLEDELHLMRVYLGIEQTRFADRLRVDVDVPVGLHAFPVPQFLLQPLIENAIRHGVAAPPDGGLITVRARAEGGRLVLEVRNPGPPIPARGMRLGVGLSTTHARLRKLYGSLGSLELSNDGPGVVLARVAIPSNREGGDA